MVEDDVNKAVNKATDAHLEDETTFERVTNPNRPLNEIRKSNREVLDRLRNLDDQIFEQAQGDATAVDVIGASGTVGKVIDF